MEILNTILEKYGLGVFILILTFFGVSYLFKRFIDLEMMNEFDKLLIPKITTMWNKILWSIAATILFNAFITIYAIFIFREIQDLINFIKQLTLLFFVITSLIIMLALFIRYILKELFLLLKIDKIVLYILIKVMKLFKLKVSIKDKVKNQLTKANKKFYFLLTFLNFMSLMVLYLIYLSESYKDLSIKSINIDFIMDFLLHFTLSTLVIFTIGLLVKGLNSMVFGKKPYTASYLMRKIDANDLKDRKLYMFYLIDERTLLLGNEKSYEDSDLIFLFDKEKDCYLEFSKLKD